MSRDRKNPLLLTIRPAVAWLIISLAATAGFALLTICALKITRYNAIARDAARL
jgi:hypothetical protein